jgi:hypothetical protein
MINSFIGLLLLVVLCMAAAQARAQNQTPANVGPVVGGWTDPATGLTWTTHDNGSDVNWNQANAYCSNLRLGGYSDWRIPTSDELQGIYDPSVDVPGQNPDGEMVTMHVKGNMKLSGDGHWSSILNDAGRAWWFAFDNGRLYTAPIYTSGKGWRALCVRR